MISKLRRAGPALWPPLFHNLRISRQPELVETFPNHTQKAESKQLHLRITGVHDGDTITGLSDNNEQFKIRLDGTCQ